MKATCTCLPVTAVHDASKRRWLKASLGMASLSATGMSLLAVDAGAASLSRTQRDGMTPDAVIAMLQEGNQRFRQGTMRSHDFLAQKRETASVQYPAAVILSCIDSRASAEIIFDAGIGDVFGARVAGNVSTTELIGSMEYACAVAGAKLVLVMGHTSCGAVAGAIDGVQLGNLPALLDHIKPAIEQTRYEGERTARNSDFVDAVALANVSNTLSVIRRNSPLLADMEKEGKIKMAGAMYSLRNGEVTFLPG